MSKTFKTIMIGIGIFALILVGVYVANQVSQQSSPSSTPQPDVEATIAPIFEVTPGVDACTTSFVVACASTPPSATPSSSPSPSPSAPPSASLDCVTKEVYADDTRNKAGFYYLEQRIADASTLQSGTTVTYNIIAKNNGGVSTPDTKITDVLSTSLTFVDSDSDCAYDSATRTITCVMGTLNAGAQTQRSFRAQITTTSSTSIANSADVFSSNGQRDTCSVNLDTAGKVVPPSAAVYSSAAPTSLPVAGVFEVTAGTIGVGLLFLILGAVGLLLI